MQTNSMARWGESKAFLSPVGMKLGSSKLFKVTQEKEEKDERNGHSSTLAAATGPPPVRYFHDFYETRHQLGAGSFGTVFTCVRRPCRHEEPSVHDNREDEIFAVKMIDRAKLAVQGRHEGENETVFFREAEIMRDLQRHHVPNIVDLVDLFVDDPTTIQMVLVYAAGGDVFTRLCQRTIYTEYDAWRLVKSLLETIHHMHSIKITHRDLKPENLLLRDTVDDTRILLADFGFARRVDVEHGEQCTTLCGTLEFAAPEILKRQPYTMSVDLWSTGCLLFMLLGGESPFRKSHDHGAGDDHHDPTNQRALIRKIRAGDYVFHEDSFAHVSRQAKQLVSHLLTVNPNKRWTAEQALHCDWFESMSHQQLSSRDLMTSVCKLRQEFSPQKTWKKAKNAIGFATTAAFWDPDNVTFAQSFRRPRRLADSVDLMSMASSSSSSCSSHSLLSLSATTTPATSPEEAGLPIEAFSPGTSGESVLFRDVYEVTEGIERGSYGTVYKCIHRVSGHLYAVKVIDRRYLQPEEEESVMNEVAIMKSQSENRFVVQLMDFYEEPETFFLVMEYMSGGDVFDRLVQLECYTEKDARDLSYQLLLAVQSLHSGHIVHRDLKPQNLMLKSPHHHSQIKIVDFGCAMRLHHGVESLTSREGSPMFVSPEVLKNMPHDHRVDLWSVGVIIYTLLIGYSPFMNEDQDALFHDIRTGNWSFEEADDNGQGGWNCISEDAKNLIRGLLVVDPNDRMTLDEALGCAWFRRQSPTDLASLARVDLSTSVRSLKQERLRLRHLAMAVRAGMRTTAMTTLPNIS